MCNFDINSNPPAAEELQCPTSSIDKNLAAWTAWRFLSLLAFFGLPVLNLPFMRVVEIDPFLHFMFIMTAMSGLFYAAWFCSERALPRES